MLVWLAMGNPGLAGGWWANKEPVLNRMFAQREPKRSLKAGMGKQVSDFREDVRPRERNLGSAGGVRANKECILNRMFTQREPKRSLEAETGKQASDFREDVRPGKRSPASLATGGLTRSSF